MLERLVVPSVDESVLKKKAPADSRSLWCGVCLIKPGSFGVSNAAVSQSRLVVGGCYLLLVVLLAAIGQVIFGSSEIQVPVPWPGDLRLVGARSTLSVAVATSHT